MRAKRHEDEERDYLVGTQLVVNPNSFSEVVKEAYALEFGVKQQQDIAEILGVDKSRVSQMLKSPRDLKTETIRSLITPLKSKSNRRRIVRAWSREAFAEEVGNEDKPVPITGTVSEMTLRRIDRMIRQSRMHLAAQLAAEVAANTTEVNLREQALDRLVWTRQRLDEPGQAMLAAKEIIDGSIRRSEPLREAAGHLMRARILFGLADCSESDIERVFDQVEVLLSRQPARDAPYALGTRQMLESYRQSSKILFMERGQIPIDLDFLDACSASAKDLIDHTRKHQVKFHQWQFISRIYMLKGDPFQAQEAIDKAFEAGQVKNLNAYELSGLLTARSQARTESFDVAASYFATVSKNCAMTEDRYHQRLVEWELARMVSANI